MLPRQSRYNCESWIEIKHNVYILANDFKQVVIVSKALDRGLTPTVPKTVQAVTGRGGRHPSILSLDKQGAKCSIIVFMDLFFFVSWVISLQH